MNNIEDMLRALVEDDSEEENSSGQDCGKSGEERDCCKDREEQEKTQEEQGLFSGLDPEMLVKLMGLLETLNQPDDSEHFLLALKPLLRPENRPKIDSALRLIKLFTLIPVLKDAGIFDKLI